MSRLAKPLPAFAAEGSVNTVVDVSGAIPVVETGCTNGSDNLYNERTIVNLPVPGRGFLDLFVVNHIVNAPPLSTGGAIRELLRQSCHQPALCQRVQSQRNRSRA